MGLAILFDRNVRIIHRAVGILLVLEGAGQSEVDGHAKPFGVDLLQCEAQLALLRSAFLAQGRRW